MGSCWPRIQRCLSWAAATVAVSHCAYDGWRTRRQTRRALEPAASGRCRSRIAAVGVAAAGHFEGKMWTSRNTHREGAQSVNSTVPVLRIRVARSDVTATIIQAWGFMTRWTAEWSTIRRRGCQRIARLRPRRSAACRPANTTVPTRPGRPDTNSQRSLDGHSNTRERAVRFCA
jgi:hypothetical protein